jgi:hypothetical protein
MNTERYSQSRALPLTKYTKAAYKFRSRRIMTDERSAIESIAVAFSLLDIISTETSFTCVRIVAERDS